MRLALSCLLILGASAAVSASADPAPDSAAQFYSYRPESSYGQYAIQPIQPRSFFTLTLTLSTSTRTTFVTIVTTCTTSTAALGVCTQSGGRRRRGFTDRGKGRELFYIEEENEGSDDSIFFPAPEKPVETVAPVEPEPERVERQSPLVPYIVQPGFTAPHGNARFLFSFSTVTTLITSTSTSIESLTAICSSTSTFQLCGSTGK